MMAEWSRDFEPVPLFLTRCEVSGKSYPLSVAVTLTVKCQTWWLKTTSPYCFSGIYKRPGRFHRCEPGLADLGWGCRSVCRSLAGGLGAAGEGGRWGPRAAVTWLGSAGPLGLREASAGFVSWGCDPGGQSGEARGLPKPRSPGSLPLSHQPKNHLAEPRVRMQGACRVSARMAWTQGGGQLGMPV